MIMDKKRTDIIQTNHISQALEQMGWNSHFQTLLDNFSNDDAIPARVVGVRKNSFHVSQGKGEWLATVAGKLGYQTNGIYPVAGDWVLMRDSVISKVMPRQNSLSRGAAGSRGKQDMQPKKEQMIAANLDTVFVVCGLDRDFNPRRIERYLTLIYNCGLIPVVILTKADLHHDPDQFVTRVEDIALDVCVHLVSAGESKGLKQIENYLLPGKTIAMVGSSGAGKSTLVNRLSGKDIQATGQVSDLLGKGRHTTTTRDLIMMPQGGMVIDNPGIREISFWDDDGGLDTAFPEIEKSSKRCRFSDCTHVHEPGCQVLHGVDTGEITLERLKSYQKMKQELSYFSQRQNKSSDRLEKERWKKISIQQRRYKR